MDALPAPPTQSNHDAAPAATTSKRRRTGSHSGAPAGDRAKTHGRAPTFGWKLIAIAATLAAGPFGEAI